MRIVDLTSCPVTDDSISNYDNDNDNDNDNNNDNNDDRNNDNNNEDDNTSCRVTDSYRTARATSTIEPHSIFPCRVIRCTTVYKSKSELI